MAEQTKVEDPLRSLYRQLGVPLAGEGDFVDVKPNTVVQPWRSFEGIHEMMDSEYARAKKLGLLQQNTIQDMVQSAQAFKALQSTQVPTQGEANALFPDFPIAPSSMKTTPMGTLDSPEFAPLRGVEQVQVPSRMQGPMPGVMTPLGQSVQRDVLNGLPGDTPLMKEFAERQPMMFEEGPRPLQTLTFGRYGDTESVPAQATVMDPTAKLPPSFQNQLAQMQHQLGLKQTAQHYPSAEELKYTQALQLGVQAFREANPGKQPSAHDMLNIQQLAAGGFEKGAAPGTAKARTETAKATIAETEAENAPKRTKLEMDKIAAETDKAIADAHETRYLLDARLKKLQAEANAANAVGSKESIKAFFNEQALNLKQADTLIEIVNKNKATMAPEHQAILMNQALASMQSGLEAVDSQRSFWGAHFGDEGPIKIQPRTAPNTTRPFQPPGIPDSSVAPIAPLPQSAPAPAPEIEDKAAKQAFGRSLKDGETKSFRGKKYTRKGNQLIEVQ